jgi:uncharacterized RDD family membrane protein YckC
MTQPPDDHPRPPDEPEAGGASDSEPTEPWTPPQAEPPKPADEGGVGYAAIPGEGAAAAGGNPPEPPAPVTPASDAPPPVTPASDAPAPPPSEPAPPTASEPSSPIISAGAGGAAAAAPTPQPGSGWEVPAATPQIAGLRHEGYAIAGVGARFVAWLIDLLLVGIIPGLMGLILVDWSGIIRNALDQARLNAQSGTFGAYGAYEIPVGIEYVLITLIALGIQYLYFVGFWTSRWQSTPGMIGLKMRVVDAASGETMSLLAATKRWIALGWPLALLTLVPALQRFASPLQFVLFVILFISVVLDDRRQGLQDKWASTYVIRSTSSGAGAVLVGCLVWLVLIVLLGIIISSVVLAAVWPQIQDFIRDMPANSI